MATVSQTIARGLSLAGVKYVFGVPGGEVLDLVSAIEDQDIRFILVKHETQGAFMAQAVYQLTGKPGAVLATVGPGAANLMLGVADAWLERSALIVLTGNVQSSHNPPYTHQVLDLESMFRPVCKWSHTVTVASAALAIDRAIQLSLAGTPGPIHLNIPLDVAQQPLTLPGSLPFGLKPHRAETALTPDAGEAIAQRLKCSQRPIAVAGLGALRSGASTELRRFCDLWLVPVVTTYRAKGILPEDHPLSLGGAGLSPVADRLLFQRFEQADLILTIGYDAVETRGSWVNCWPPEKVINIDETPNTDFVYRGAVEVTGHIPSILAQMCSSGAAPLQARKPWATAMAAEYRRQIADVMQPALEQSSPKRLGPYRAVKILRDVFPRDTIATCDTGAHRIMANHAWESYHAPSLLQSTGLGSMGAGIPLAIGAKLVQPSRPVLAMVGDGGLLMFPGDLATAAELGLPIVVAVFSDQALSLIKIKQEREGKISRGVHSRPVDFARLAEALGGQGVRVSDEEQLRSRAREALGCPTGLEQ